MTTTITARSTIPAIAIIVSHHPKTKTSTAQRAVVAVGFVAAGEGIAALKLSHSKVTSFGNGAV